MCVDVCVCGARRYKWDVIRSIFKSITGFQKGKVAELERGANAWLAAAAGAASAAIGGSGDAGRGATTRGQALRQNIRTLLGIGTREHTHTHAHTQCCLGRHTQHEALKCGRRAHVCVCMCVCVYVWCVCVCVFTQVSAARRLHHSKGMRQQRTRIKRPSASCCAQLSCCSGGRPG